MTIASNTIPDVTGARVTIVGAARSGIAAARLLSGAGASVFVTESSPIPDSRTGALEAAHITFESGGHTKRALEADFVVTSPGVPDTSEILTSVTLAGLDIYSEVDVASWFCQAPIVAITGSNGKTTTTSLTGHIFRSAGKVTHVVGNIGHPFSDVARTAQSDDVVVLEISSFQLDHMHFLRPTVSVLLNITPDHMDRYGSSMDAYAASKFRIGKNQRSGDAFIFNMDDDEIRSRMDTFAVGDRPATFGYSLDFHPDATGFIQDNALVIRNGAKEEVLMQSNELALKGRHNAGNSLASAIAARIMEVRSDIVRTSLASFEGVPHRLEFVREVDGVQFVNDSKATNVNAVWYALESMSQPLVLIAGGRDKGNDYAPLRELVRDRVRILIVIGESAPSLEGALGGLVDSCIRAESMGDAVRYASLLSKSGEAVLLSPACASFDMFESYEDRGDTFKRLVSEL